MLSENVRNLRKYRNLKAEINKIKCELKDIDAIIRNIEKQKALF